MQRLLCTASVSETALCQNIKHDKSQNNCFICCVNGKIKDYFVCMQIPHQQTLKIKLTEPIPALQSLKSAKQLLSRVLTTRDKKALCQKHSDWCNILWTTQDVFGKFPLLAAKEFVLFCCNGFQIQNSVKANRSNSM